MYLSALCVRAPLVDERACTAADSRGGEDDEAEVALAEKCRRYLKVGIFVVYSSLHVQGPTVTKEPMQVNIPPWA